MVISIFGSTYYFRSELITIDGETIVWLSNAESAEWCRLKVFIALLAHWILEFRNPKPGTKRNYCRSVKITFLCVGNQNTNNEKLKKAGPCLSQL